MTKGTAFSEAVPFHYIRCYAGSRGISCMRNIASSWLSLLSTVPSALQSIAGRCTSLPCTLPNRY